MKIVACVKYCPDAQADRHFTADATTEREAVDGVLSELDEYAVEQALTLVEREGGEVVALTVGPEPAALAVRKALQMGADSAVHVQDDAIGGSDALATSLIIAKAVEKIGGADLVLTRDDLHRRIHGCRTHHARRPARSACSHLRLAIRRRRRFGDGGA